MSFNGAGNLKIISVNGERPRRFSEKFIKSGFYVTSWKHIVESEYQKTREFGVASVNTTYEPTKQEIEVVAGKTYRYGFDEKTESYVFEEIDAL